MFDPLTILAAGVVAGAGYLTGRAGRRPKPKPASGPVCSCGHGFGTHADDGKRCAAQVERPHYYSNGARNGYEWAACACLRYDGPDPAVWVWSETK